jgi:hypothetical protein
MHASFFAVMRCTFYVLLIVVVEILRFGASATKAQDDRVRKERASTDKARAAAQSRRCTRKSGRPKVRCGTW